MKERTIFSNLKNQGSRALTLVLATIMATTFVGCASDNNTVEETSTDTASAMAEAVVEVKDEETIEPTVEVENETEASEEIMEEISAEESQSEEDTSHLSNEEWVESLNIQEPTFMVFNEITGKRKVLENGQEYKLVEGDELAYKGPWGWGAFGYAIDIVNDLYDTEAKYNCLVYHINFDAINEDGIEFRQYVEDFEGKNRHDFILYLSK